MGLLENSQGEEGIVRVHRARLSYRSEWFASVFDMRRERTYGRERGETLSFYHKHIPGDQRRREIERVGLCGSWGTLFPAKPCLVAILNT